MLQTFEFSCFSLLRRAAGQSIRRCCLRGIHIVIYICAKSPSLMRGAVCSVFFFFLSLSKRKVKASRLPDDVQLLQRLVEDGLIVATPPQDYDDSYCIKYAMAREG